jgi:amino acid adenylation domain-containing protein
MLEKAELLSALRARDVQVFLDGDRLRVNAPRDALTAELQEELVRRKGELVAYLREAESRREEPPLTRAARDQALPTSFAQERLWFLQKLDPESVAYNLQANIRIPGRLDVPALERALAELVRRHEVLRTTFAEEEGRPVQVVAPASGVALALSDLRALPEGERAREVERLAKGEVRQPFDLERGPVFRARVVALGEGDSQLLVTQHHVVTDGWSIALLVEEVLALYDAFSAGLGSPLPEPEYQYADFAHWQRRWLRDEVLERRLAYWRGKLAGAPPTLELPTDRPRPAVQTSHGATLAFELPEELARRVHAFRREVGATPFMTLLAAFQVLLARYSGQEDVVVGSANGNRSLVETERMLGLFVNTIVLRTDVSGDPTFRELVSRVRRTALDAVAHGDVPFEKLVEGLRPPRDLSRSPVFQALFVIQNTPLEALVRADEKAPGVIGERGTAAYDLSLYLIDTGKQIRGTFEYNTDLFEEATVLRLCDHYRSLVAGALAEPDRHLSEVARLSDVEARTFGLWNATRRALSSAPVHERIASVAVRRPEAIALVAGSESVTYADLESRANRLARRLRGLGVRPGALVALHVERTLDMVVGLLGILKAGGAYLPLDPTYPRERMAFILEDARPALLLANRRHAAELPAAGSPVAFIEDTTEADGTPLPALARPDDLAYAIFTSGSTGRPKGVLVQHRALSNLLASMEREPGLSEGDVLLAVTTLAFDIAGLELLLPLVAGGRVVLASRDEAADPTALRALLEDAGITVLQATPATWRMLVDSGWGGKAGLRALCGGEPLPVELARALKERCAELWNVYGPTETTIWSTAERIDEVRARTISIGRPIANTTVHLVDSRLQPVPLGAVGELLIGGAGVACGYLDRPGLTAERFVPDPFGSEPGARLYRTGDLAWFRADGKLECLGRVDHQVKLRGFRIELGEVEAALLSVEAVKQAAVLVRERAPGERQLVAFVVFAPGDEPTVTELRAALRDRLPGYMVPSSFVFLDAMPAMPNGKVDRNALKRLDAPEGQDAPGHVEPRTAMESLVAEIWKEALGVPRVSVHDNFFDIGGHSLLSMHVLARLEKATGGGLGPRDLVFQTLEQLAALCERRAAHLVGGSS